MDFPKHEHDPGGKANAAAAEELLPVVDGGTRMVLFTWNPSLISNYVERKQL